MDRIVSRRRSSTYEPAQTAKTAKLAVFATKMRQTFLAAGHRADRVGSARFLLRRFSNSILYLKDYRAELSSPSYIFVYRD